MRACANAKIVAKLPIVQIVQAPVARLGVGRNFIPVHARSTSQLGDPVQHGVGIIVFRQHGRKFCEVGIGLDSQVVNRDVRGLKRERLAHVQRQVFQGLSRQRIHDVQVEGIECLGGFLHRCNRLGAVMHAAQRPQMLVVKTLHTD